MDTQQKFNPTYLTSNQVIKVNIPRIGKRKPWRHASPSDYHVGRINYTSCWNKDTLGFKLVRIDFGHQFRYHARCRI